MNPDVIFIYGPPCSGKSTAGQILAKLLDLPFYDLDAEIENISGKSIPDIFGIQGEASFRQFESQELSRILREGGGVISLGGGALLDPQNRVLAETRGIVVVLSASLTALMERLVSSAVARPLLGQQGIDDVRTNLGSLLERRASHYASFPIQIDTSALDPEQTAWHIQVELGMFRVHGMGSAAYDVRVLPGGLDRLGELLKQRGLQREMAKPIVAIVSDENVGPRYIPRVEAALASSGFIVTTTLIPAGEENKTLATLASLWEAFLTGGVERGSTILALGGGVVSDLAGFAAAVYLRGVDWVAVPTSLLAMGDASLGGKTGADLPQGKNLIGAFHAPRLVLADPETLSTLPESELGSGLAEVVKSGIISDPVLFDLCVRFGQGWVGYESAEVAARLGEMVRRTMAVKVQVIEEDPFEKGRRAALNLGHTVGHAVELVSGFRLRHGEAVAIGLVVEACIAEQMGLAESGLTQKISSVLSSLGLPTQIPAGLDLDSISRSMGLDKKKTGGKVRFALPLRIGEVRIGVEVGEKEKRHALNINLART